MTAAGSVIREIHQNDVAAVVALVHELADYEREPRSCHLRVAQLHAALFGPSPALFGLVAEAAIPGSAGAEPHVAAAGDVRIVGCALWFLNFSTWRGVHGIYLEDLYVQPAFRGRGLGRALLARLATICAERGYGRLEWSVLDWNAPAIAFYRSIGAAQMDEWTTCRLEGSALTALATPGAVSGARPVSSSTTPGTPR